MRYLHKCVLQGASSLILLIQFIQFNQKVFQIFFKVNNIKVNS